MPRGAEGVTDQTSATPETSQPLVNNEGVGDGPASEGSIARRAYQRFDERGREHGRDLDDWFQAEQEIRTLRTE